MASSPIKSGLPLKEPDRPEFNSPFNIVGGILEIWYNQLSIMPPEDVGKLFSKLVTDRHFTKGFLDQTLRPEMLKKLKKDEKLVFTPDEEIKILNIKADSLTEYAQRFLEQNQQQITRERE